MIRFAPFLLLAACATTGQPEPEPRIITVERAVPVSSPCVPANLAPPPQYKVTVDTLLAAPDAAARLPLAVAGMLEREARLVAVEPVIAACPKEAQ